MKNIGLLLLLILTTSLFAQEKLKLSSTKNIHILEGTIANKYPITMHLTIEEETKKVEGQYYYNKVKTPIYFGESVLDKNSTFTLKEFEKPNSHESKNKSTGQFTGTIDKKMVFKGIWSDGKKSFDFEVKPNKKQMIQEIQIKEYSFITNLNTDHESPTFEFVAEIFQIANPKKLAGINKINEELEKIKQYDFDEEYPLWKENMGPTESYYSSWGYSRYYEFVYSDNNILSLVSKEYGYTGGAHGWANHRPLVYSVSGEVLNEKIDDLVYSIEDEKLIALLRKKLKDDKLDQNYFNFDSIRLRGGYKVGVSGITFVYSQYEIAPYVSGIIEISFTYAELKPFVKKDSKLYYLFE